MKLPLLYPRSMYIVRQKFNAIKFNYFGALSPQETISKIEQLVNEPIQEQAWVKDLSQYMRSLGIDQNDNQQKIIEVIIILLNNQKRIAEVKVKHAPVTQNISDKLTSAIQPLTHSQEDDQLIKASHKQYSSTEERAQGIIAAIQNGANPNMPIKCYNFHTDLPVLITFLMDKIYDPQYFESLILANAELEITSYNESFMSLFFTRFCYPKEKIAENLKLLELFLSYGINPDAPCTSSRVVKSASPLFLSIVISFVKERNSVLRNAFMKAIELFLNYGADLTEALEYARTNNFDEAITILEKHYNLRLSNRERQLKININLMNELHLPRISSPLGLTIKQPKQIKEQNIINVAADYSFNALRDKMRQLFFSHGVNLFQNNSTLTNDLTICVELLLLMMDPEKKIGAIPLKEKIEIIQRADCPDQLILNFSFIDDAEIMEFIKRLNTQFGTATARSLQLTTKDNSEHLLFRAVGLNLAVLIERIFPRYAEFIQQEFARNIVRKKYYQCVTGARQAKSFESTDAILKKYALVSESCGLTYKFNPNARFLVEILLRIFNNDTRDANRLQQSASEPISSHLDPQYPGMLIHCTGWSQTVAIRLMLIVPETTEKVFLENINKQFPGAANLIEVYTGVNSKLFEIFIDKETISGPIFELYKAKLADIAENDLSFLERLQIQCKTRQKSTPELVAQLNGVAQQVEQANPKLARIIANFSGVLNNKRRATAELREIDWSMKAELNRIEARICDAKDEAALNEFKKVKKGIREVEREIGLRPK